jgi:AcrR family transcriptional regulator
MASMPEPAALTARAVARRELTSAIVAVARRQMAEIGPAQLSVRAVARELNMASSAVYRYFPSRDELLTELLVIIYDELADATEQADARRRRGDFSGRWLTLARTTRSWAVSHPQDYALLYGSPVPGYAAPERTIPPAARVTAVLIRLLRDVHRAGAVPAARERVPRSAHRTLASFRQAVGEDLPDDLALRGLTAWGGLIGALTLELFGHLQNVITDHDTYFDLVARRLSPVL